ncbi:type II secretion system F family protein [Candidatus Gottesmanbacteria bacterium]|nr:type II secretion system F family protein [Candidatus Gottesmanbacteria bacterium]
MAFFTYAGRDSSGKSVSGLVEAPSVTAAARILRDKKLFVISLSQGKDTSAVSGILERFKRVGFGDIVNITQQLSTMIIAGLSLPEALTILRTQTTNAVLAAMLEDIESQIVSGGNLADAVGKYPQYFSAIYIALVRAGETSGTLDKVLERLAETLEDEREFRGKVSGAMIYPAIILLAMSVVVFIMMTVVIPKLTDLYKDFGTNLPASTQFLIALSSFFVHFWWGIIAIAVGLYWGVIQWRKTLIGELTIDTIILRLPLVGDLKQKSILVTFTRTFAMLIASGIHILEGLRILKDSLDNVLFRNAVAGAAAQVEKGFPLGESFRQYRVFPPIVSQMMKVGEETGKLDDTLTKLSRYFETESERLVKGLTTAIEPIIMVFLGVGVGFIVISVITPIYNLTSQIK